MGLKRRIKETPREKRKKRKVKPTIVIVCEGKETEPIYFEKFRTKYVNVDVKIPDKSSKGKNKGKETDPSSLVEKAIYYKKRMDIIHKDGDRVWCIFDVDINYQNPDAKTSKQKEIESAYKDAYKNNIYLGISNPCFELWYLLHFQYTTGFLKDGDAVKQRLNTTPIKNYKKNVCIHTHIKDKINIAIDHAKKLKAYHEDLGKTFVNIEKDKSKLNIKDIVDSNPYTNIGDLIEYMESLEHPDK